VKKCNEVFQTLAYTMSYLWEVEPFIDIYVSKVGQVASFQYKSVKCSTGTC